MIGALILESYQLVQLLLVLHYGLIICRQDLPQFFFKLNNNPFEAVISAVEILTH